ncbi:MAG: hypothetical protein Q8Q23_03415 [bacterium]|nr:hypothetical protein [bacterium]
MKKPYDKNKIGKFIGWGGEHLVFAYGDSQVIKFSLHVFISGKSAVDKIIEDYHIGKKYFDSYILDTAILPYKNGRRCAEIQSKITCRFLTKKDLNRTLIKKQFDDIMERYQRMNKELKITFDLFGREGLLHPFKNKAMSNILVTPEAKLVLIDFSIMKLKKVKLREIPIWLLIEWARRRQEKLLNHFINYNPN